MALERTVAAALSSSRLRFCREQALAYLNLTKPRIVLLLLLTTVPAMLLAADGSPSLRIVALTLLGGAMTAGSANAINCYWDRDIDSLMNRTRKRALPSRKLDPEQALLFGLLLGGLGVLILEVWVGSLAAALAAAANAFYVLVYTVVLKRTTDQNIVIGGAAGAMPPVVGWAAVTGSVELPALLLFGIIFIWTPPHFWSLSMVYSADYERARVPMMPLMRGREHTALQVLLYSLLLLAVSLLLWATGAAGLVYLFSAALLGLAFAYLAFRLWREPSNRRAMAVFKFSLAYLALLFMALTIDTYLT